MDTLPERAARALLLAVGLLSLLALWDTPPPGGVALVPLLHHQFLIALLAIALISAACIRRLRLAVLALGVLSKAGLVAITLAVPGFIATPALYLDLIAIAALLGAGGLLLHATRQQARWDGLMPQRVEA